MSNWQMPSWFWVKQGNGWSTAFNLTQNGTQLTGRAKAYKYWIKKILIAQWPEEAHLEGSADGTLTGDSFEVKVFWSENSIGVYKGTVNPQGRVEGTTFDQMNPRKVERFHSEATLARSG